MYIADLHIHSRFSRATSRDLTVESLALSGWKKGIGLIGTGDFTHPEWRKELSESLEMGEDGLYRLKSLQPGMEEAGRLSEGTAAWMAGDAPRFVVTGEISSIYKQDGKVRKVHNLILLPDLSAAERLSAKLELIGNLHSDGRPILGLSSRDLLEITMEVCPEAIFVPAHIWTPHFSMFGAFSGFDRVEDCFGDMTPYIHAVETGLSSDPPMNWRLSALDRFQLISNSDAHSAAKLGREANLMEGEPSYEGLYRGIQTGEGLYGTLEFFPEEGKYHYDGHRKCHLCLSPRETERYEGRCPVCGKKLTVGVSHRVEELADRPEGYVRENAKPFESLVPLREVIAASEGMSPQSVKAERRYEELLQRLGTEFYILREAPLADIRPAAGERIAEGIRRLRAGEVDRRPGYDGEYGRISLFSQEELDNAEGQMSFFAALGISENQEPRTAGEETAGRSEKFRENPGAEGPEIRENRENLAPDMPAPQLNEAQRLAAESPARAQAVIAGPGTGKTKTLIAHIIYLIRERGVNPAEITAVTFTRKAAAEIEERLSAEPSLKGKRRNIHTGTFHALCLELLRKQGRPLVLARDEAEKNALLAEQEGAQDQPLVLDFDGLIAETLKLLRTEKKEEFRGKQFRYLLVDEFQDVSPEQLELICRWNRGGKELFVIGDPDQSIYGFRGADAHCFEKLAKAFPELCLRQLNVSYRSAPEILEAAGSLIAHNGGSHETLVSGVAGKGQDREKSPVRFVKAASGFSEAVFIAKEINRMAGGVDMLDTENGFYDRSFSGGTRSFSEIAVLYRTNRQGELLEKCLKQEGIPYILHGREDFLSADSVQGTLCFFQAISPGERPEGEIRLLRRRAAALLWKLSGNDMIETVLQAAEERFRPMLKRTRPAKLLEAFAAEMNLGEDRDIRKLCSMSLFYPTMQELTAAVLLGSEGDLMRSGEKRCLSDGVRLMTLHAAKGLEFPVVIICGFEKGKIPLERKSEAVDMEEERRLFYVGITRAKEQLILTGAGEDSPFLPELPEALLLRETAPSGSRQEPDGQLSLFS